MMRQFYGLMSHSILSLAATGPPPYDEAVKFQRVWLDMELFDVLKSSYPPSGDHFWKLAIT